MKTKFSGAVIWRILTLADIHLADFTPYRVGKRRRRTSGASSRSPRKAKIFALPGYITQLIFSATVELRRETFFKIILALGKKLLKEKNSDFIVLAFG